MVVDFGFSSLKISIVDNGRQISYKQDAESGFSSVDLSDIVGYDYISDVSDIEQILFGLYLKEVVRRNLNKNAKKYNAQIINFMVLFRSKGGLYEFIVNKTHWFI